MLALTMRNERKASAVIRPTAALWKNWGGRGRLHDFDAGERKPPCHLWDWFAREATPMGMPIILVAERETLLTLILPKSDFAESMILLRRSLVAELMRFGVPQDKALTEADGLSDLQVAKNNDRSTMGSLTSQAMDLEYMAEIEHERHNRVDLGKLQTQLNETPHCSRGNGFFTEREIARIFGLERAPR